MTVHILRSHMNQERYLRCHASGQLLNWVKNKTARIHLIGRGTHTSSKTYATFPRVLVNTSILVEPCARSANRSIEVGKSRVIACFDTCFDILVQIIFHTDKSGPQGCLYRTSRTPNIAEVCDKCLFRSLRSRSIAREVRGQVQAALSLGPGRAITGQCWGVGRTKKGRAFVRVSMA